MWFCGLGVLCGLHSPAPLPSSLLPSSLLPLPILQQVFDRQRTGRDQSLSDRLNRPGREGYLRGDELRAVADQYGGRILVIF